MSEEKLHKQATDAARAKLLLEDELLIGAFKALEEAYIAHWRATRIDDAVGREKLFIAVNVVGKVKDHLGTIMADGALAKRELEELAKSAERQKILGII